MTPLNLGVECCDIRNCITDGWDIKEGSFQHPRCGVSEKFLMEFFEADCRAQKETSRRE